jgi:accessory colonization factor AcfC
MPISTILTATRRRLKMERIARLEVAGYKDEEIAATVGITKTYVSMLRRTPEYIGVRVEVASGVLSEADRVLLQDQEATYEQLKQLVPSAMLTIKNTLHNSRNPKLQFDAAKEILDREGTFAKISKSEIKVKDKFEFEENTLIVTDLLAALQKNNPEETEAMMDSFTNSGLSKEAEKTIQEGMKLVEMPSPTEKIQ